MRHMRVKTLIVGGGVMGVSIAFELARRADAPERETVLLVERRHLGAGSSGRSGAILRQHYRDPEVATMARDSLRKYTSFETRTGLGVGFHRTGVLTLCGPRAPEWTERIRANVRMLKEHGIVTELLEADALRALLPAIRVEDGTVAAWEPDGGFVDPNRTVQAFATLARRAGAVTQLGVEVRELRIERGKVVGASTSDGYIEAETVVIVAGPWSRALLEKAGIRLPLKVVRPENHFLGVPEWTSEPAEPVDPRTRFLALGASEAREVPRGLHPVLIDLELGFYARCDPDYARSRVGRVDYDEDEELGDPDTLDETVSEELKRWARRALAERVPEYAERPDAGSIAAWYTLTPDAQALIGPIGSVANLFVVTGFSGHGFKLAPSVGEGVAQMLRGEPVTAFDPDFFALSRFSGGESWRGRFGL